MCALVRMFLVCARLVKVYLLLWRRISLMLCYVSGSADTYLLVSVLVVFLVVPSVHFLFSSFSLFALPFQFAY